jgi:hypothetical protein
MKRFLAMAVGAAALALTGEAHAATFLLNYASQTGAPVSADLTVTAADVENAAGGYDITGISGHVDADAVSGLIDNPGKPWASYSADGWFIFDNVIWPTGAPVLSNPGIFFRGVSGDEYNLFSDNASTYELYRARAGVGYVANSVGALTVSPSNHGFDQPGPNGGVPEPAAWALMIIGLGGVGAALRRRRSPLAAA